MRFSLRGKIEGVITNATPVQTQIFDYVSSDRRKGWKVVEAYVWPITMRTTAGGGADGQFSMQACLATDAVRVMDDNILDPSDNRYFAWGAAGWKTADGSNDGLYPQSLNTMPRMLIDPDPIIVKELHITIGAVDETGFSQSRDYGYLIVLEERKLTPEQSVFQQIKGMGQDIE